VVRVRYGTGGGRGGRGRKRKCTRDCSCSQSPRQRTEHRGTHRVHHAETMRGRHPNSNLTGRACARHRCARRNPRTRGDKSTCKQTRRDQDTAHLRRRRSRRPTRRRSPTSGDRRGPRSHGINNHGEWIRRRVHARDRADTTRRGGHVHECAKTGRRVRGSAQAGSTFGKRPAPVAGDQCTMVGSHEGALCSMGVHVYRAGVSQRQRYRSRACRCSGPGLGFVRSHGVERTGPGAANVRPHRTIAARVCEACRTYML
jgi:hypothetical protein